MRREPEYGRDYWPRTHRPNIAADFDYDRPCGNCGYNLRGLHINEACPECGSVGGLNPEESNLPWEDRRNWLSYIETMGLVLFGPHTFAKLVWSPLRIDGAAARAFRRIAILVSAVTLCIVAVEITRQALGFWIALIVLPINAASIVVWLNSVTLSPIAFIRGTGSPIVRRAELIAHYTSAGMLLAPLHLLLLLWTSTLPPLFTEGWLVAAGAHLALLFVQLLICAIPTAWMFFELVDCTPSRALGFTTSAAMTGIGAALPLLIGAPALFAVAIGSLMR